MLHFVLNFTVYLSLMLLYWISTCIGPNNFLLTVSSHPVKFIFNPESDTGHMWLWTTKGKSFTFSLWITVRHIRIACLMLRCLTEWSTNITLPFVNHGLRTMGRKFKCYYFTFVLEGTHGGTTLPGQQRGLAVTGTTSQWKLAIPDINCIVSKYMFKEACFHFVLNIFVT